MKLIIPGLLLFLFSCQKDLPSVITSPVKDITSSSALGGGTIVNSGTGKITERGICWNSRSAPTINNYKAIASNDLDTFTSLITDLASSTKYYVRAYVESNDKIIYGNEVAFLTLPSSNYPVNQIIADHTVVDQFDKIPQQYIDEVKNMLVWIPGMSHGAGYFNGLLLLQGINSKYAVDVWYHTPPPAKKSGKLQIGRPGWGGVSSTHTINTKGDFYDEINLLNSGSNIVDYVIFGWSYEATWGSPPSPGINPVYNVHWYGVSKTGPDGDKPWGLTSDDYQYTGNSICMDSYINGFNEFNNYFVTKGYKTKLIFSTLPVDGDPAFGNVGTEAGFQRELKSQYIREYVASHEDIIFFDYADILRYNDNGELYEIAWNQSGTKRYYSQIHPDNQKDLPGVNNNPTMEDHIGGVGAVRLGKALWWLFARLAGWDGN